MAISIREIQVGKFFVCGPRVREIAAETAGEDVVYYTYLLRTGEPFYETSDTCSKRQITRMADREATPQEIARMKTREARDSEKFERIKAGREMLAEIPDDWLRAEVKRRGWVIK